MKRSALWWIGQVVAPGIGLAVSSENSSATGVAVAYALLLLIDIREAVQAHNS